MSIAARLRSFLNESGIEYDLIHHPHSSTSVETARQSNVPRSHMAKAVIVHHIDGYAMSVVPGHRNVHLQALQDVLHYRIRLAREDEIAGLFPDCETGAVPPLGFLYGLKTIVDETLSQTSDVYFEAGDHESVVHVTHGGFEQIMQNTEHAAVSCSPLHH